MGGSYVEEGTVVMIMRTDGRLQPGVIKSVMRPRRIAVVEWDEQGERKGKAVTFNDIFALNAFKSPVNVGQPRAAGSANRSQSAKQGRWKREASEGNESKSQPTKPPAAIIQDRNVKSTVIPRLLSPIIQDRNVKSTVVPRLLSPMCRRKPMTATVSPKPRTQGGISNISPPRTSRNRTARNLSCRLFHGSTRPVKDKKNKLLTQSDVGPPLGLSARESVVKPSLANHRQASTSAPDASVHSPAFTRLDHSQAFINPCSTNHSQALASPCSTNHSQAFINPCSTNHSQAFTSSPDAANHSQAFINPCSTNQRQSFTSSDLVNQERAFTSSPDATNHSQAFTSSPDATNHSQAYTASPDATNHSQAFINPCSTNHTQASTILNVTNHSQVFTSPDLANHSQVFTSPDLANQSLALASPDATNQRQSFTSSDLVNQERAFTAKARPDTSEANTQSSDNTSNKYCQTVCEPRVGVDVVLAIRNITISRQEQRKRNATIRANNAHLKSLNKNWELIKMMDDFRSSLKSNILSSENLSANKISVFISKRPLSAENLSANKISVFIRKRPLSARELEQEEVDILTVPNETHIVAHELKQKVEGTKYMVNHCFRFDHVFDVDCSNRFVYEKTAKPLVMTMFAGGRSTCFAYGQTGSGKTHTMGGAVRSEEGGIYGLVACDVFHYLLQPEFKGCDLEVVASYYEIYCTKIYDLLNRRTQLSILEDSNGKLNVCHVCEVVVTSAEQVMKLILKGNMARSSGRTSANENSSRSHAVFQLVLRVRATNNQHGVFSLIDLAGNERGSDNTCVEKMSKRETGEINKSLLVLKECIRAMGQEGARLPFRNCKLTHVLRDSFIGDNIRTCMIATVSPGNGSMEHSIDTIKYADRVKGTRLSGTISALA